MILYTEEEYQKAQYREGLSFKCDCCNEIFLRSKREMQQNRNREKHFCSFACAYKSKENRIIRRCANCNKEISVKLSELKKSKSGNSFCSKSCACSYNMKHKDFGCRKSKFEVYLEGYLCEKYTNIDFTFNGRKAINSELDIYIKALNLAFEINGIYHYEPIYGNEKFKKIQENDINKINLCIELGINLHSIDVSEIKYFKIEKYKKHIEYICSIIDEHNISHALV